VFLLPRVSTSSSTVGISKLARGGPPDILAWKYSAAPHAAAQAELDRQIDLVPPVAALRGPLPLPCRFPEAPLPGLLGQLQASPRGRLTRRIGRTHGESGNIHFPTRATALRAARHLSRQRARQAIALGVLRACRVRAGARSPATSTMVPCAAAAVAAVGAAVWNV
jgi:hypothetical protein